MLSIIVPCLNEARNLPLLLADLKLWPKKFEILVVDAESIDKTSFIAGVAGAKVLTSSLANRGSQLRQGAEQAKGSWLLFIHADSRLPKEWPCAVRKAMNASLFKKQAWYFDLKVPKQGMDFRILELAVYFRSHFLKEPYGDQGLLINKNLYEEVGGHSNLHIMEDIDFIYRFRRKNNLKSLALPIYTNPRKWQSTSMIKQACKNHRLRNLWKRGQPSDKLFREYYQ